MKNILCKFCKIVMFVSIISNDFRGFLLLITKQQQQEVDGYLDNSTCGTVDDISVECTGNGAADLTPNLVNNFVNDPRATSFQVFVYYLEISRNYSLINLKDRSSSNRADIISKNSLAGVAPHTK